MDWVGSPALVANQNLSQSQCTQISDSELRTTNHTEVLIKKRNFKTDTYISYVKRHREKGYVQAKERGLEQIFSSQSEEGTNLTITLISDA